jgi:ABC-type sugar transport system ATPase subunit
MSLFSDVLCGRELSADGMIIVDEKKIKIQNEFSAHSLGIYRIARTQSILDDFSIAENFFVLRRNCLHHVFINHRILNLQSAELLKMVGLQQPPTIKVSKLSTAEKQLVELAKAWGSGAKIVIFDKAFDQYDLSGLLYLKKILEKLKKNGLSFIICCNSIESYTFLADRIVIFRDGSVIKQLTPPIPDEASLYEYVIGYPRKKINLLNNVNHTLLSVSNIKIRGQKKPFSFFIRQGEILGLFWKNTRQKDFFLAKLLEGSKKNQFSVCFNGISVKNLSLKNFSRYRIVFIPPAEKDVTLLGNMDIGNNLLLPSMKKIKGPGGFIGKRTTTMIKNSFCNLYHIDNSGNLDDLDNSTLLPLVFERWLIYRPKVVILKDPFLFADMKSSDLITSFISKLSAQGAAVLIVSSRPYRAGEICHRNIMVSDDQSPQSIFSECAV